MIEIKKKDFDRLRREHPDWITRTIIEHAHNGVVCKKGDYCAIEGALTGDYSRGCTLIFEHIHFEIV